jgi:hypothetical protein
VKFGRLRATAIGGVLVFCVSVTAAQAVTVVNFDDLNPGAGFWDAIFVPAGYAGFTWSGVSTQSWVVSQSAADWFTGTQAHSGNNFAWSNGADDLSLSGGLFDFNSMWARIGNLTSGTATAHGFDGATEIYTQTLNLTDTYQLFSLNFDGITSWTLTNQKNNVLIDDITLNAGTATPLPAALPLFATGLGGLGLLGWRKKRKAITTV